MECMVCGCITGSTQTLCGDCKNDATEEELTRQQLGFDPALPGTEDMVLIKMCY